MKRAIILLTFVFAASITFAQKGKVTSAQNYKDSGDLEKALKTINEAIDASNEKSEKSISWPKTWEVRGEIYQAIYQSKDEKIKALADDPLTTAYESYKKALELDDKDRFGNSVKIKLTLLTNDLTDQAVNGFNTEDYGMALKSFEEILSINDMPLIKGDNPDAVDTVIIYNTGLAAYNAQQYDKAIKYYKEAAKYGYNGARTYSLLAGAYQQQADTTGALEVLQEGFEKYPEDATVLNSMIQIYMDSDKSEEALKYLKMAIEKDPKNATYHFAEGVLFEKLEDTEKAIEAYKKAIEVDSENYGAYYNLGALYYNKGIQQLELANSIPANENERYIEETKKADVWWEQALPYMEKCNELKPDDVPTLESLKNLYYRMKQMDKYNAILEKLGQ